MAFLIFQQEQLPRTMNRVQWYAANRWRRITQRTLGEFVERNRDALDCMTADACIFGTATARIRADMIERMVNPPVMIYPDPAGAI